MYRFFDRSRENLSRGAAAREFGRDSLGLRDGSEMVVSDACVKGKDAKCYLLYLSCVGGADDSVNFMFFALCFFLFYSSHVA